MSNPEAKPDEVTCVSEPAADVEILTPREVPLGGLRAMTVRRTLPQRERSLIGAWCFVDHYGPDLVADIGGMSVAPHPHTGLQTVSWLFTGEIEHRDSAGHHAMVRPGEVNLMTAGRGISHSEISTPETTTVHGAQLWVALPDATGTATPPSNTTRRRRWPAAGWEARVFLGSLLGDASPVTTHTPLLGAELLIERGRLGDSRRRPGLRARGPRRLRGAVGGRPRDEAEPSSPTCPSGRDRIELVAHGEPVRVLLLGGPPFGEAIVMWWNFVGRSHEEIVGFRAGVAGPDRRRDG